MVLVGRVGNVASYLGWTGCLESGKGGGSRGVNMKTGPYGEEGDWSNGRSVSALQRQGETETEEKHLVQPKKVNLKR